MIHPYEHVGANPKIRYENEKGEAQTFSRLENLVEGLNLTTVGWTTGLEPATTGTTSRCSTN